MPCGWCLADMLKPARGPAAKLPAIVWQNLKQEGEILCLRPRPSTPLRAAVEQISRCPGQTWCRGGQASLRPTIGPKMGSNGPKNSRGGPKASTDKLLPRCIQATDSSRGSNPSTGKSLGDILLLLHAPATTLAVTTARKTAKHCRRPTCLPAAMLAPWSAGSIVVVPAIT